MRYISSIYFNQDPGSELFECFFQLYALLNFIAFITFVVVVQEVAVVR